MEDEVGYLVPVEGHPDQEWSFLSSAEIKSRLDVINSFHTFLIIDACFSGSFFLTYKSLKPGLASRPSRLGLASSHSKERALDGSPGENSPFARSLLRTLADSRSDLSVHDLAGKVIDEVLGATGQKQTPIFKHLNIRGDDLGQFVFQLRNDEGTMWESAVRQNALSGYNRYLERFPGGEHVEEAIKRMEQLEDEIAWSAAEKKQRISSYQYYLQQFPEGQYVTRARQAIQKLLGSSDKGVVKPAQVEEVEKSVEEPSPEKEGYPSGKSIARPLMVEVSGGVFNMGCTKEQGNHCDQHEKPVRQVTVSTFALGKCPVTYLEYDAYCEATNTKKPKEFEWGRGKLPVAFVSWLDAIRYCNWLSRQEGLQLVYTPAGEKTRANWKADGYRLPTEAEWEYAARGGAKSQAYFYAGGNYIDEVAWYRENSGQAPHPVGVKKANELGIHDMSGNVCEWCWDSYDMETYQKIPNPGPDPKGPKTRDLKVLRGGSWDLKDLYQRVSKRYFQSYDRKNYSYGFRLARSIRP